MRVLRIINHTFRYFWTKAVSHLEKQLRYPQTTLEWREGIVSKDLKSIPLKITVRHPKVKFNKEVVFNNKNTIPVGHSMTLRSRSKKNTYAVAALDPGIRVFQTLYDSNNNVIEFGSGDVYNLQASQITDIHDKVATYLLNKYEIILIPRLDLDSQCRFYKLWRHCDFVDLLLTKAKRSNSRVIEVEESWTSKTCSSCGSISSPGTSKTFRCPSCNLIIDRDVNGARNILLKNMNHLGISFKTQR